jgi:hypothetical protein
MAEGSVVLRFRAFERGNVELDAVAVVGKEATRPGTVPPAIIFLNYPKWA